jgi:DNA-binding MarR family transcriptional regulator
MSERATVTRSPDAVAAAVLRALERRYRRARSWATASALAAELRLDAAEVARALARLAAEGRVERAVREEGGRLREVWGATEADG